MPVAGDRSDGVGELLRGEAADFRPAEDILARLLAVSRNCGHLIGARRKNGRDQALDIVTVFGKVAGEPVEQFRAERFAIHFVLVLHDAVS